MFFVKHIAKYKYINCFTIGIKAMSSMTITNRNLKNAGYPVQDRFAFNFGKTEEYEGFAPMKLDEMPDI